MRLVKLKDIAENMPCNYGDPCDNGTDGYEVVKVSNVNSAGHFHGDFELRTFDEKKLDSLLVREGELLVVKSSGSKAKILSGKTAICGRDRAGKIVASNFLLRLRINEAEAYPRFVWYALNSGRSKAFIKRIVGASTYPNLKWSTYRDHPILLPPLSEQKRIAKILDRAEALRAKRRAALALLDELTQSIFLDMFGDPGASARGWSTVALGDVVKVVGGYAFKSKDFSEDGLPVIRISNLTGSGIDFSNVARIAPEKVGKGVSYKILPGDILMAMSGATTGKLGIVPAELKETVYQNQRVGNFRITDDARIAREFLVGFIRSPIYQRYLWNLAAGVAQPNVSGKQLESATLRLPPIGLQREYGCRVARIGKLKGAQESAVREIDKLFVSLRQRAFRGEL